MGVTMQVKTWVPFCSSDTALHTIIKRMRPAFYRCISTTLCPHKDLSKRSKTAGQADLSASVAVQRTCQLIGSGLLLLSKHTDFLKYERSATSTLHSFNIFCPQREYQELKLVAVGGDFWLMDRVKWGIISIVFLAMLASTNTIK